MRPLQRNGPPLRTGWVGRIRVLRQPLAVLLGLAPAPDRHPRRPPHRVRADRRQSRRTPDPAFHPGRRSALAATRPGQTLIADRQYYGARYEAPLAAEQLTLLSTARKGEPER